MIRGGKIPEIIRICRGRILALRALRRYRVIRTLEMISLKSILEENRTL